MHRLEGGIIQNPHRTITVRNEEVLWRVCVGKRSVVGFEFLSVFLEDNWYRELLRLDCRKDFSLSRLLVFGQHSTPHILPTLLPTTIALPSTLHAILNKSPPTVKLATQLLLLVSQNQQSKS